MKYCSHCGNELVDDAVICPKCGCATEEYRAAATNNMPANKTNTYSPLSIVGFVFAFIGPLVGLICSIVAYKSAVAEGNEKCKTFAKAGIIVSAVIFGLEFVYGIIMGVLIGLDIVNGGVWYY